uniref:Collagen IV NC1 domain-containing protein n=1 Tax=Ciona savignyi TaxID=51511 RepID=H2Z6J3_CIOSA
MLNPIRQQCQRCIPRVLEGKAGPPGQDGDKGLPGLPGENGLQGARGAPGFPGPQGESGIRGPRGDTGDKGNRGHAIPGAQGTAGLPGRRGKPGKVVRGKNGRKGVQGIEGPRGHLGQPGIQGNRGQCEPTDCGALPQYPQSPYEYTDNKGPPSHNGGAANRPPDEEIGVFPTLPGASGPNERLPNLPNVIPAVLEQLKGPLNVHVVNLEQFAHSHESDDLN